MKYKFFLRTDHLRTAYGLHFPDNAFHEHYISGWAHSGDWSQLVDGFQLLSVHQFHNQLDARSAAWLSFQLAFFLSLPVVPTCWTSEGSGNGSTGGMDHMEHHRQEVDLERYFSICIHHSSICIHHSSICSSHVGYTNFVSRTSLCTSIFLFATVDLCHFRPVSSEPVYV